MKEYNVTDVKKWWNEVNKSPVWDSDFTHVDWEDLQPLTRELLEVIFYAAREGTYDDLDVRMERME